MLEFNFKNVTKRINYNTFNASGIFKSNTNFSKMSPCGKWVLLNKAKIIVNEELHDSVELTFKIWMEISSEKIRNYLHISLCKLNN